MAGIEELVGGDPRPHRTTFNAVERAEVHSVSGGNVRLTLSSFDGGKQTYADVPFAPADASPSQGDLAFLHCDSAGFPAYAYVFSA